MQLNTTVWTHMNCDVYLTQQETSLFLSHVRAQYTKDVKWYQKLKYYVDKVSHATSEQHCTQ